MNSLKESEIRALGEYQIISIPSFWKLSLEKRILVNNSINNNYLNSHLSNPFIRDNCIEYNFPIVEDETSFFSNLYEKYKELCYKLFGNFHINPQNQTTCWCYRSNKDWNRPVWHKHLYTSTINGVYYYQVDRDGIFFERNGKEFYYVPKQGELLIFPNYLNHRPDINTSQTLRYSINMEIKTEESASTLFKNYGLS